MMDNNFVVNVRNSYKNELIKKLNELFNQMFVMSGSNELLEIVYDGNIKSAPHITEVKHFGKDTDVLVMFHDYYDTFNDLSELSIDTMEEILSTKQINFSDGKFNPFIIELKEERLNFKNNG